MYPWAGGGRRSTVYFLQVQYRQGAPLRNYTCERPYQESFSGNNKPGQHAPRPWAVCRWFLRMLANDMGMPKRYSVERTDSSSK